MPQTVWGHPHDPEAQAQPLERGGDLAKRLPIALPEEEIIRPDPFGHPAQGLVQDRINRDGAPRAGLGMGRLHGEGTARDVDIGPE